MIDPFSIGVCSWSLQVRSVPELADLIRRLGIDVVQVACGDPHHASWNEGDDLPAAAKSAGFRMSAAMLGFPGEDYSTPRTIQDTGGFGPESLRAERLARFEWALAQTKALGLTNLTLHAGFIPPIADPSRIQFLRTLTQVGNLAAQAGITASFETGQESADLLKSTLDELNCPNLKVNFDPANMLLYDMGDPLRAVEILAPHIQSVHVKDAMRPKTPGQWGQEVRLGDGEVDIPKFVQTLKMIGFQGPLIIERESGGQAQRFADIQHGVTLLRSILS